MTHDRICSSVLILSVSGSFIIHSPLLSMLPMLPPIVSAACGPLSPHHQIASYIHSSAVLLPQTHSSYSSTHLTNKTVPSISIQSECGARLQPREFRVSSGKQLCTSVLEERLQTRGKPRIVGCADALRCDARAA